MTTECKKNIVLLTDCLAYLTGGAERQIFELARRLDKEKYSVRIASLECEGSAPEKAITENGCRLVTFPVKRIYGLSGILEGCRFMKFLKREKINVLVTYHFSSDIWGTLFGRLAKVNTIISNRRDMGFWRKRRHLWAYNIVNPWVKKIVVVAHAIKKTVFSEKMVSQKKIEVIYNGVDHKLFNIKASIDDLREKYDFAKSDLLITHVANITPIKGHIFLFKALKRIINKHPNVKLLVIGADEMGGKLDREAERLNIEKNIFFLGERRDVNRLLKISDICVLPSLSEGMSNALLEYMSVGKPIIATRVGGNPELIQQGVNGLLVEKENVQQLEEALLTLIQQKEKRATFGANGLQMVQERFSMHEMVTRYEMLFDQLINQAESQSLTNKRRKTSKVLHLISSCGFFGAESILLTLGKNIKQDEYHCIVGAFYDDRNPEPEIIVRARELGIETWTLKCNGRFDLKAVWRLRQYLVHNKIDILHTHNYKSDTIGVLASWLAGIPIMATAHGFTDVTSSVSRYERIDRWILKSFFHKVVTVTNKIRLDMPGEKKHVIPNGVDITHFVKDKKKGLALRKKLNVKEDDILVGTVGRLSREKNQKMLLEAIDPIVRESDNIKVLVVGVGPTEAELKQLSATKHLAGRVIFTGMMQDTVSVYSAIDIFVLSSLTEGVPLTVLEAMASQIPVIATSVGGVPDIIDHAKTGLLVESKDTDSLRKEIKYLIKNKGERRRLGQSASEFVKINYSLGQMCNSYKQVYNEVLQ